MNKEEKYKESRTILSEGLASLMTKQMNCAKGGRHWNDCMKRILAIRDAIRELR